MKIIITGGCGHIGSYIIKNIEKINKVKQLIIIDNLNTQRVSTLFNLSKKIKKIYYNKDLSEKNSINNLQKVDLIIHFASHTNAENSFNNKKEMFKNNLGLMKNIISYCIKHKSKLIHISSTSVYGNQAKIVNEEDKKMLNPQSPYAEIKLIEEKMLKKAKDKINYISFRFGTIAGVSPGMRFHTAINKFCFAASFNQKINIYKTAYKQFRPYLSIRDAFKTIKFCIEKNVFPNDVYNILSGNYTVEHVLKIIKKYKKKIKVKYVSSPIMNQLSYHVENKKIEKLGLKINSNIETDIKNTLKLFNYIR